MITLGIAGTCHKKKIIFSKFHNFRICGVYNFTGPTLLINDLELIKRITIKDFDHFTDHLQVPSEADPLFFNNVFSMRGKTYVIFYINDIKKIYMRTMFCALRIDQILGVRVATLAELSFRIGVSQKIEHHDENYPK